MAGKEQNKKASSWADPLYYSRGLGGGETPTNFRPKRAGLRRGRLTKSGMLLVLTSLGIGSAAYNTSSNILYLALAMLLATLLLSGVLSLQNFRRLRQQLHLEPRLRVGQASPLRLSIENRKRWAPTYGLTFVIAAREEGARKHLQQLHGLAPGESQTLEWLHTPARRGEELFELLGVESLFPFGFLRRSVRSDGVQARTLIWPARADYVFDPPRGALRGASGSRAQARGEGAELTGLREYRPGDPARRVHWKASARLGRLLVKETAEERDESFALWIDAPRAVWGQGEQFEQLCAVAASIAEDLFMRGQLSHAGVGDLDLQPLRRLADLHGFLDQLAKLQPAAKGSVAPASRRLITIAPRGKQLGIYLEGHAAGSA